MSQVGETGDGVDNTWRHPQAIGMSAPEMLWLPIPGQPGRTIGAVALELSGDCYVGLQCANNEHYTAAAGLARKRLRRCKPGSTRWSWYTAVIAEDRRRRRSALRVVGADGAP